MKKNEIENTINGSVNSISGFFDKSKIDNIIKLSENKKYKFYKKHKILFREDTEPLGLYYLVDGKIKIYKNGYNGNEQIIRFASPGDLFGMNAIIAEKNHITSSTAIENSFVCIIPPEDLLKLTKENPDIFYYLINTLSKLLRETDNRTISIIHKSEKERLAETLLILSKKFNPHINLLKKDLANFSIIERNKLKPYLSELKKENLIYYNSERIKIRDVIGLKKLAKVLA